MILKQLWRCYQLFWTFTLILSRPPCFSCYEKEHNEHKKCFWCLLSWDCNNLLSFSFSVTEIERRGALDLSEPLEKMLPFLGISLDGKYKPALVFKEDDPLGISVITQRLEGKVRCISFQGYLVGKLFWFKVIYIKCYFA